MDALRASLPAGTLSGAPKIRAMQIIDELEPVGRGPYGGAVGYLSYTGDLDTCIYIRSALVKDGRVHIQAGGGIVADSDPAYEVRETEAKAGAVMDAIRLACDAGGLGMTSVLVVDNYDSFTYNLVQYLGELGADVEVVRNDLPRAARAQPRPRDRVARPVHAGGGRALQGGDPALRRGRRAGARRVPRAPGAGRRVRRPRGARRAGARQDG